jgi:hypothetical protein
MKTTTKKGHIHFYSKFIIKIKISFFYILIAVVISIEFLFNKYFSA